MNTFTDVPRSEPSEGSGAAKLSLLEHLQGTVPDGIRWALRGGKSGLAAWLAADGVKDLDVWVHSEDVPAFVHALAPVATGTASLESDPRWLRHLVLVMSKRFDGQLIDITYGDLRVGAALTCREPLISIRPGLHGPMLTGVAAVSDLLLRKLLRGKTLTPSRLAEASLQWHLAPAEQRRAWLADLGVTFNASLADRAQAILSGRRIAGRDRVFFLLRAAQASLRHGGVSLALRRRRRFVLGRRQRVPLKRPVAPVLFLVNGEGSATLAARIKEVLAGAGVTTQCITPMGSGPAHWATMSRLAKAGIYGHAVTLLDSGTAAPRLPLIARLCGEPIPLDSNASRDEILQRYYLAAHRWYIDDPLLAEQITAGENAMAEQRLVSMSPLAKPQPQP
ncbi:hypothetical protein ACUY1T_03855 [Billgrantia sp. Q4P2]|uniref:hypothetical protein n=1 Tax=Billgrantia sp. Q4P2 TaxID=3463857 RepID=UPI004057B83F